MKRESCREDTAPRRFWSKVIGGDVSECWIWQGSKSPGGYGNFIIKANTECAHRVAYRWLIGPIPEGLDLDHLCKRRDCVNPWHLEPVTRLINIRRSNGCRATETHCANGHAWTAQTTRIRFNGRKCGECERLRTERYRAEARRLAGRAA